MLELVSQTGEAFLIDGPTLEARAEELWQITSWAADPANPNNWTSVDAAGTRYAYTVDSTGGNNVQSVTATFDVDVNGDTAFFVARPALTAASLTGVDDDTGIEWALNAIDVLSAGLVDLGEGAVRFAPNTSLAATAVFDRDQATVTLVFQPARRLDPEPAESATGTLALTPAPSESTVSSSTQPVSTIERSASLPPKGTTPTTSTASTTTSSTTTPPTSTTTTSPPTTATLPISPTECHPAYSSPCLPITSDLNCPDIEQLVKLRDKNVDPYRLDGNDNDGIGCESYA